MTRVLAFIAVGIALLSLVVALNVTYTPPAEQESNGFTYEPQAPRPTNKFACENAGMVWIPDDQYPGSRYVGDCVS